MCAKVYIAIEYSVRRQRSAQLADVSANNARSYTGLCDRIVTRAKTVVVAVLQRVDRMAPR